MLKKRSQLNIGFLLVFSALFLSNFSAFFGIIWLFPRIVLAEMILWSILAIFSVWALVTNNLLSEFIKSLRINWYIFPFLIFSGISIFWSTSWDISLYRWLVLLFIIIVGGFIGVSNNIQEVIKYLSIFGLFILLLSGFLVLFLPGIGVMNYHIIQGAWKGLYWHKNQLGLIVSFINLLFLIKLINSISIHEKRKFSWGILYLISLLFIYKSDSVAAYFTTLLIHGVILIALIWLKIRKKIRSYHYFFILITIVVVLLILFLNIDTVFSIFNRNSTLTGRIPMWSYLYNTYIVQRPIGGYGFNAFWYDEARRVAVQQAAGYPDPIVISDNGFIDLFVNTGFIGLFLFLVFYFCAWWRSIKYAWKATNINGFFPMIFMAYTLIANISWSLLFENESFVMLIMITLLFCISRDN